MTSLRNPPNRTACRFVLAATFTIVAFVLALAIGPDAGAAQDKGTQGGPSPAPGKPGLNLNTPKAYAGYTLFSPTYGKKFYLIDMDGKLVKEWDAVATPGAHTILLPNGNFLRADVWQEKGGAGGGGAGGRMRETTWDGKVVWDYSCPPNKRQHHDFLQLPNGNILMPVWDPRSAQECTEAGRRGGGGLNFDSIIEVKPNGPKGGEIVWEWNLFDHLVQDFDKSKKNYGEVAAHPELVDINFGAGKGAADKKDKKGFDKKGGTEQDKQDKKDPGKKDKGQPPGGGKGGGGEFTHVNGISYNPELDQIVMSVHKMSEFWIIDHSTTKAEAASHKGGKSGKGGDLLYRWGNPQVYRAGTAKERELFSQHNAHWIPKGLPGEGHILVFNNGSGGRPGGNYSTVDEIALPIDAKGNYSLTPGKAFGPEKPAWTYVAPKKTDFFSTYISGAQRLPNGNTLICSGANGTFFEVTADKEVVWKYVNPSAGKGGGGGGKGGMGGGGDVFRAHRYAADYPGLKGRDLTPGKTLEDLLKKDGK
ncbi:MAG TPA: aryl-sulfate sulfotransferase [Gemmataceae bacterium]|nr:aryl-sulfate sulfotransferase [Gemmataceae bacterium]